MKLMAIFSIYLNLMGIISTLPMLNSESKFKNFNLNRTNGILNNLFKLPQDLDPFIISFLNSSNQEPLYYCLTQLRITSLSPFCNTFLNEYKDENGCKLNLLIFK